MRRAGFVLLGLGVLVLGFVAYQLWGTALYEHSAQARLHQEIGHSLHTKGTLSTRRAPAVSSGHLVISQVAPATADPAVGAAVGLISMPTIGVADAAIVEGTDEGQLQEGPGHYLGTPLPGEAGNAAIAGHRTTYGAPFYSLDGLKPGDPINVETPQGLFQYTVFRSLVVDPTDTTVLQTTALPTLTLTTCNPRYSASQRLVVQALLHTSIISTSFQAVAPTTHPKKPPGLAGGAEAGLGLSGTNVRGGVIGAVLWGLAAAAAAVAAWIAYRRLSGSLRLLTVVGAGAGIFFLLACFQHVSLALPASF